MFESFLQFCGMKMKLDSKEEFINSLGGKSFLHGAYRFFSLNEIEKWEKIVATAFPEFSDSYDVFGYDWLGRIFAEKRNDHLVLLFEPGTGEVLDIPVTFEEFHNTEIVKNGDACIALGFFKEWYKKNNQYVLDISECVGYKVPLFLNGEDTTENLEVSDMDVYWTIIGQLLTKGFK